MRFTDYFGYKVTEEGVVYSKRGWPLIEYTKKTVPMGYKYVSIMRDGVTTQRSVHSIVYEAFHGPLKKGYVIDHIDNNPTNNEASNLQALTTRDNSRKSGNKLTLEKSKEIRERREAGEKGRDLALEYGVSEQTICDIYKNRKWK